MMHLQPSSASCFWKRDPKKYWRCIGKESWEIKKLLKIYKKYRSYLKFWRWYSRILELFRIRQGRVDFRSVGIYSQVNWNHKLISVLNSMRINRIRIANKYRVGLNNQRLKLIVHTINSLLTEKWFQIELSIRAKTIE